jgi:phage terminase large subunit GpA-like protein
MDLLNDPHVDTVVICAGSQIGKTEALYNMLGYVIDQDPAPAMIVMPTLDLARSVSATRIRPMIEACDTLAAKIPVNRDEFALQEMQFPGMVLTLSGANSPASLASRPVRYLFLDEVDKFPTFTGKEADPISLSQERQKTFWNRKTIIVSTPTVESGHIWKHLQACDEIREYFCACPHCGSMKPLSFGSIKWPDSINRESQDYARQVSSSAWYECPDCNGRIDDRQRQPLLASGKWIAVKRAIGQPRSVGLKISSLYSPWLRWGDVAEKFIQSKPHPETLQNFINSWLAEPFIESVTKPEERYKAITGTRSSLPRKELPEEADVLTCGIDVQKAGFWYLVRAWSRDTTSWLIDYGFLTDWSQLESLLWETQFTAPSGKTLRIWRALIDTGGGEREGSELSSTEETYQFLRRNWRRPGCQAWGAKGAASRLPGNVVLKAPLDRTPSGKAFGLQIVAVDTDKAKSALWWRYEKCATGEPAAAWMCSDAGEDYIRQIMAEEQRRDRSGKIDWQLVRGKDNHLLDCECLAWACTDDSLAGGLRFVRRTANIQSPAPEPKPATVQPQGINPYTGKPYGTFSYRR